MTIVNGKIKRGTGINRGYIGYHTTWNNKRVFLRSKCEFIYARVLDKEKIYYLTECVTYLIGKKRYKPDFFIFDADYKNIKKIVEIKGFDDKKTSLQYMKKYKKYFNDIGIEYEAKWKYQALITKYNLLEDIQKWIESSLKNYDFVSDTRGQNNPMYGVSHTKSTKKLIGDKCRKRNKDSEYVKKCKESQQIFWQSARGKERKNELSLLRKKEAEIRNPIVNKKCTICGDEFKDKLKSKKEYCSSKCIRRWRYDNIDGYGEIVNKKDMYKKQLITLIKRICSSLNISNEEFFSKIKYYVAASKLKNIIPSNKGMSEFTIKKYNIQEELIHG